MGGRYGETGSVFTDARGADFYQERLRVIWEAFRSIENDELGRPLYSCKEQNQIPQNSDLCDSGCIEQDAHIIMFLFLPAKQCYGDIYPVQLWITKNRKGRKGLELELVFWAHRSKSILPKKACPPENGDQKE